MKVLAIFLLHLFGREREYRTQFSYFGRRSHWFSFTNEASQGGYSHLSLSCAGASRHQLFPYCYPPLPFRGPAAELISAGRHPAGS